MALVPPFAQALGWLRAGELPALYAHYGQLQTRFEQGDAHEDALDAAFELFAPEWIPNPRFFDDWRAHQGDSPARSLAEARWYFEQALFVRGDGGAANVSDFEWRRIGVYIAKARRAALASLAHSPRSLMSCILLGRIERIFSGCFEDEGEGEAFDWYGHGLGLAPDSALLALARLQCLRPEWGGSKAAMAAFVEAQPTALQPALRAAMHRFLLHHAAFFEGTPGLIQTHFDAAEALQPESAWNCFWRAMAESREGDGAEPLRWIQRAREREPENMELFWYEVEFAGWAGRNALQRERLESALQLGNFRARRALADALLRRTATEAEQLRGLELLREGHGLGDPICSFELAQALGERGEVQALQEALAVTAAAAATGDADCALLNVALRIDAKQRPAVTDRAWLAYLHQALAADLPAAPGRLAQLIERGWLHRDRAGELRIGPALTGVDWRAAFRLRLASAEAGEVWQQREVGRKLLHGEDGAPTDASAGLLWLRRAADAGDPIAQHLLAQQLLHGRHLPRDSGQARLLLALAIEDDLPEARRDRAIADLLGLGEVWGSAEDALQALAECVEQEEDPIACEALAAVHLQGVGVARNPAEAMRWLRRGVRMEGPGLWMWFQYACRCAPWPIRLIGQGLVRLGLQPRPLSLRFE